MDTGSKIKSLRWRERGWSLLLLVLLVTVLAGGLLGWLWGVWLLAGAAIVIAVASFLWWLSRRLDGEISQLAAQVSYDAGQEALLLYERSPLPYLTLDQSGLIVECNQAAVHLFQSHRDDLLRSSFRDFLVRDEATDTDMLLHKITNGLTLAEVEALVYKVDQQKVWVLLSVYPHRDPNWHIVSLLDITERKAVDTAKSEFVALATHQLRTPIAALRWNLELLTNKLKAASDSVEGKYLERIERNVLLMSALINDFLNVSKLEMGTFATTAESINLAEFFNSIFDEFNERIVRKNIRVDKPELAGWQVATDKRLLHIIVSNLVSNAVKYLPNDGALAVILTREPGILECRVADTGIGIPADEIDKLFTKFFRATNAHTQETEGTGLGLYVVKQSVEKLGGTITVESKQNQGTTFIVRLPLQVEQVSAVATK